MTHAGKINLRLTHFTRGEVVLAELLRNMPAELATWIYPKSTFRRPYAEDITEIEIKEYPEEKKLVCLLHRDGLYDLLPEGLFHQPYRLKHFKEVSDMVEEVKHQRKKQEEARTFFLPFEQEFYRLRVLLEQQERSVFENDLRFHFTELKQFWGIDPGIRMADDQLQTLLLLLPFASRITSNDALAAWAFSAVLGDPVTITRTPPTAHPVEPGGLASLGDMQLGTDAVLGNLLDDGLPGYQITVGPLAAGAIPAYLEGGQREPLLSLLEGYFMPVEADSSRCFLAVPEDQCFALATEDTQCLLGFTTYI